MLAAHVLHAALALLWMQSMCLHATLLLLVHRWLDIMLGPRNAPHWDVLLHVLRKRML